MPEKERQKQKTNPNKPDDEKQIDNQKSIDDILDKTDEILKKHEENVKKQEKKKQ